MYDKAQKGHKYVKIHEDVKELAGVQPTNVIFYSEERIFPGSSSGSSFLLVLLPLYLFRWLYHHQMKWGKSPTLHFYNGMRSNVVLLATSDQQNTEKTTKQQEIA